MCPLNKNSLWVQNLHFKHGFVGWSLKKKKKDKIKIGLSQPVVAFVISCHLWHSGIFMRFSLKIAT